MNVKPKSIGWLHRPPLKAALYLVACLSPLGSWALGAQAMPEAAGSCVPGPETLCLGEGGRFKVSADFQVLAQLGGGSGRAAVMDFYKADGQSYRDTGLLRFFGAENLEVAVTVLNGCRFNGAYWVKTSGATNQGYTLRVEDTLTGAVAEYGNPLDGELAEAVIDTAAFPSSCGEGTTYDAHWTPPPTMSTEGQRPLAARSRQTAQVRPTGYFGCAADATTLCLGEGGRFRVTADYQILPQNGGGSGPAGVMELYKADGKTYRDTGLFWFFRPENLELAVSVINGCDLNGAYWVKSSGATNQGYTLRVQDMVTGAVADYGNPMNGGMAEAVIDVQAFPHSCPREGDVVGSGNVVEVERPVRDVKAVTLLAVGSVYIEQGAAESLRVRAEDNLLPYIRTQVVDGTLQISFKKGSDIHATKPIEFFLTVRTLDRVVVAGVGGVATEALATDRLTVQLLGVGNLRFHDLAARDLEVLLAGVGNIAVSGEVDEQVVTLAGVGDYQARDLQSAVARVLIAGIGSATVRVSDLLVATISGHGSIYYIGNPTLDTHVTGDGDVIRIGG